jgi:guanylate kinase
MKKEKIIILGKSGSGKNYLMDGLVNFNLKPCVKTTTRPKRNGEKEGIDYFFITKQHFFDNLDNNTMLVYQDFIVKPLNLDEQIWYYGITKKEFNNSDIVILTPKEYNTIINSYDRKYFFVVFLDIEREIRKNRLVSRNDNNDSIDRRLDSDDLDFKNLLDYDLRITDPDFSAIDVYSLVI